MSACKGHCFNGANPHRCIQCCHCKTSFRIVEKYKGQKCQECENPVDLKAGDEISPTIGKISPDYGEVELCRACFSKGWSSGREMMIEVAKDTELGAAIGLVSPFK